MIKKIIFWLNNARLYTLPITVITWIVAFLYCIKSNGNIYNGILALLGISLVHLATNLIDDYVDFNVLKNNKECQQKTKSFKCAYLQNNSATIEELKNAIIIFLLLAAIIGGYFFFTVGFYVAILAIIALLIALLYPKLSQNGLGEIAVISAYGPLFFEGISYVMCRAFSLEILILSLACGFWVNTILYTHMLMDYDADETSHKITLCRLLGSKEKALNFGLFFYFGGYIFLILLANLSKNYLYLIPILTLPMVIDLYKKLSIYNSDKTNMPQIHFWNKPLDKWENVKATPDAPFYFRFIYSRNIVIWFMVGVSVAILF
jgi:1,4-dihydroxy-2-naphthoate octaprenyltransferase